MTTNSNILLGSHMSASGGMPKAVERGESIGCTAMQVFVKGNTRWKFPALKPADAELFRVNMAKSGIRSCIAHAIYLVNCASNNPELQQKSTDDLADELERCDALCITGLVLHPGAHGGDGLEAGTERIVAALNSVFAASPNGNCRILLETTAGQGTSIGGRFEHIAEIMSRIENKHRIGVCLDTCHIFSAGYEIRTPEGYDETWKEFDRVIGLKNLFAIHLNDSKKPFGSHLDRHEHIGKGEIGLEAFRMIMNDPRLAAIPKVLETPKDESTMVEDVENMSVLKSLVAAPGAKKR